MKIKAEEQKQKTRFLNDKVEIDGKKMKDHQSKLKQLNRAIAESNDLIDEIKKQKTECLREEIGGGHVDPKKHD